MIKEQTSGFVYLWFDTKQNKFYLGSHQGTIDDGYIASNRRLLCVYKSRPHTLKRRILEYYDHIEHKDLLSREQLWLSLIDDSELHGKKYYNEKKVAAGGDIISTLSEEKREQHKIKSIAARQKGHKKWLETLSSEEKIKRAKYAKSCVKDLERPTLRKKAKVIDSDGNEFIIENIRKFCEDNNLNYGNMKTVLRGNGSQKSCGGYKGIYL